MKIASTLSDAAILQALGQRISEHRLQANLTQAELAARAGVGKRTLERIEAGGGAELTTFVRILRALGLADGLDRLVPEIPPSPIARLELHGKRRRRASGRRGAKPRDASKPWKWGEE
ncbi:MAG: helix-turn-helix domain-containing protein [Gammaproteobacteria bacterium]|nr:transcriptional regulator [Gammaproteobacteria bacterium]